MATTLYVEMISPGIFHTNENERTSMENELLIPFPVETKHHNARIEQTFKYINIEVSCECKRPDTSEHDRM